MEHISNTIFICETLKYQVPRQTHVLEIVNFRLKNKQNSYAIFEKSSLFLL